MSAHRTNKIDLAVRNAPRRSRLARQKLDSILQIREQPPSGDLVAKCLVQMVQTPGGQIAEKIFFNQKLWFQIDKAVRDLKL